MAKRKLSAIQIEYREFFLITLTRFGVNSPAKLDYERKKEFFNTIKDCWKEIKKEKRKRYFEPKSIQEFIVAEEGVDYLKPSEHPKYPESQKSSESLPSSPKKSSGFLPSSPSGIKLIESKPNPEQRDDLIIKYNPNQQFRQEELYKYPVVKMPSNGSKIKLPRQGRSNQKGYKENEFFNLLKTGFPELEINNDLHITIPFFNRPYEPDMVLIDKSLNLYIDIEIDEPYDGYYRCPTHEEGKDETRDLFFNESGWIVIRFTEKQIHEQANQCITYIKDVLNSIYVNNGLINANCLEEMQWDNQQSIRWEKEFYREKYLGIEKFGKQKSKVDVIVDVEEKESIESSLSRTKKFKSKSNTNIVSFEEEEHIYRHPLDVTGNAEYISVTTLIDRFFPFDLKRFIQKEALNKNRDEAEILENFIKNRDEAAEKGTYLHNQIEKFLIGDKYDQNLIEFKFFKDFYEKIILPNDFKFKEAEKRIVFKKYNLAGTIDALFKKPNTDEYIILDWKRSKKLVIDGYPRKMGYGYALSELSELDNSSYYKYSLQQNIYRYILEKEYGYSISSMKLVVLHEQNQSYHIIPLSKMDKEVNIILNSINHKI